VALSNPSDPDTAFVAPMVGQNGESLAFHLTVTDNSGLQSFDTSIVNVVDVNIPPISSAGTNQLVDKGTTVTLDGSQSSDADDGIVTYLWEQVGGISVNLSDPSSSQPSFTSPHVEANGEALSFQLTVTDSGGLQSADACIVNVSWSNIPPISDAGPDQALDKGALVTLDGSKSSDPDDGIGMYLWKQVSGIPVILSDSTAIQPHFTAPQGLTKTETLEFNLTVTDNGGLQSSDSCVVSVASLLPALHISSITIGVDSRGKDYQARATAVVVDDRGNTIKEAVIIGNWELNGNYLNTSSVSIKGNGTARLDSLKIEATSGDVFSISIIDVVKDGFSYDPIDNTESATVP
jgi:hypothetical protein